MALGQGGGIDAPVLRNFETETLGRFSPLSLERGKTPQPKNDWSGNERHGFTGIDKRNLQPCV